MPPLSRPVDAALLAFDRTQRPGESGERPLFGGGGCIVLVRVAEVAVGGGGGGGDGGELGHVPGHRLGRRGLRRRGRGAAAFEAGGRAYLKYSTHG